MGSDDWYLHYGLDRDPFAEGDVHGLFYPGGGRQETVDQLLHLARFGDSVLLVVGPAGMGKSTTLTHFVAQSAPDTRCALVETALLDGPEQLLQRVLAGFGLPMSADPDLAASVQRLARFCERCADEGVLNWVVFDDAQHLHAEALGVLAPLLERLSGRLRLIFFAEEAWAATLRAALPATVAVHMIELLPFGPGESHAYLHYRLKTAGLESEPPFSAAEMEDIHRQSGGAPGRINALARRMLVDELEIERRPLAALPLWHLGVVAATLLLLGGLYVWSLLGEQTGKPAEVAVPAPAPAGSEVVGTLVREPRAALPESAGTTGVDEAAVPDPEAREDVAGLAIDEPTNVPDGQPPPSAPAVPVAAAPAAPAVAPPAPQGATTQASQAAVTQSSQPPIPQPLATPSPAPTAASSDEAYLLALDGSRYLLQLMASDDLQRLQRFAAQQSLALRQYSKLSNGRRWYALVHGDYPDRASAERAARELGPRLGGSAPWVRSVAAVQREIRAGSER